MMFSAFLLLFTNTQDNASQIYFCSFALTPGAIGLLYNVKPFKQTKLPGYSVLGNTGAGVSLDWLKARQKDWLNKFDWSKEEAAMNKLNHSTVDIGNITVHFVHQRSSDPKAIPVLLTHGWPGSFYKFHNVISPLSNPGGDSNVSFHVVVPLMPGFSFSSPAPIGRNINMTADLFNTLLTEVLGYKSYAAAAGDWGSGVNWALQNNHADTLRAVLYDGLIPQLGPSYEQIASGPQFAEDVKNLTWKRILCGAFYEATIGLALYDNPIGQLAWIGEKFLEYPQFGVSPSTITNNTILTEVSIYYLTGTFETAGNTYYQNSAGFSTNLLHAKTNVPMGFASYYFDIAYYPPFYVAKVGNLVYYADHPRGGHFTGLDNPDALIGDLRKMMGQWYYA
ncbi:epoxide hydrolase [Rhizoctonia solani]|uniref:Epoxide hydrolase n=1 Tax=Rhizoctonia solani TaxID=456999 RepID=A0A8H8P0T1_9AGAM|nr:epoxide hydrolase [Rhizoctonia solani]QRW23125.1 epoxide hydrolase [Rhizoctonia solani]